jgi:hypothetical protein
VLAALVAMLPRCQIEGVLYGAGLGVSTRMVVSTNELHSRGAPPSSSCFPAGAGLLADAFGMTRGLKRSTCFPGMINRSFATKNHRDLTINQLAFPQ